MYCKNCGKETLNSSGVCDDCLLKEFKTENDDFGFQENIEKPKEKSKKGFGFGLAGVIIAGIFLSIVVITVAVWNAMYSYQYSGTIFETEEELQLVASTFKTVMLFCMIPSVISLPFGIVSLTSAKKEEKLGKKATLPKVLGIISLGLTALLLVNGVLNYFLIGTPIYIY